MLTKSEMNTLETIMNKMEAEDFNIVASMFNDARRLSEFKKATTFKRGQKVKWAGRRGNMSGVISKVNRKSIIVLVDGKDNWKVSPSLLQAA